MTNENTPQPIYKCPECGFYYREKEWADKCEAWWREHKSCNLEITANAEENKYYEQTRKNKMKIALKTNITVKDICEGQKL